MSVNGDNGNNGVRVLQKHAITIQLDTADWQVHVLADGIPIQLAQMMLDEAQRLLEQIRRQAAVLQLQKEMQDAARVNAIMNNKGGG